MSYIPPLGTAANASFEGLPAYVQPMGNVAHGDFSDGSVVTFGQISVWTGAHWQAGRLHYWTGAIWVPAAIKRWDGVEWQAK